MAGRYVVFPRESGEIVNALLPNPAPGANFIISPPVNMTIKILALRFAFVTDATVITRTIMTTAQMPGGIFLHFYQYPQGQLAAAWVGYDMAINYTIANLAISENPMVLPDLFLRNGDIFATSIGNLQPGDQVRDVSYQYLMWRD